jgi:hypothetical protein
LADTPLELGQRQRQRTGVDEVSQRATMYGTFLGFCQQLQQPQEPLS